MRWGLNLETKYSAYVVPGAQKISKNENEDVNVVVFESRIWW